jgi:hypothetical protein
VGSSKEIAAVTAIFSKVKYVDISLETNNLTILICIQPDSENYQYRMFQNQMASKALFEIS